jgi:hypothetical protein
MEVAVVEPTIETEKRRGISRNVSRIPSSGLRAWFKAVPMQARSASKGIHFADVDKLPYSMSIVSP